FFYLWSYIIRSFLIFSLFFDFPLFQFRVVTFIMLSQAINIPGSINRITVVDINAPLAIMPDKLLTNSISDTKATPTVEAKKANPLVVIDFEDSLTDISIALNLSYPLPISSLNLVVKSIA